MRELPGFIAWHSVASLSSRSARSSAPSAGKTKEEVALLADTDQARISRIEEGANPSYGLAHRIALALGWSMAELVCSVEARERSRQTAARTPPGR